MEDNSPIWKTKLYSHSLKLFDAQSPEFLKHKHINQMLTASKPQSEDSSTQFSKPKVKPRKRERYLQIIDQLVKQYAKQKEIPVQIPTTAIRKTSFKSYRIFDPQKQQQKEQQKSLIKLSHKSRVKSMPHNPKKQRNNRLRQRIQTQTSMQISRVNKSSKLPSISKNHSQSSFRMIKEPQFNALNALKYKLRGETAKSKQQKINPFQHNYLQRYLRCSTQN